MRTITGIWALLPCAALVAIAAALQADDKPPGIQFPANAKLVTDVEQFVQGLWLGETRADWSQPRAMAERPRGPSHEIYAKVAPAVVVVRVAGGHGTGFLIGSDGWILTNHHVIEHADFDAKTGARQTLIHFGKFGNGLMTFDANSAPALVYKSSPTLDLALLKLADSKSIPSGVTPLKICTSGPKAGSECHAIGHPATGLLWSIRPGTVTAVGDFPHDRADVLLSLLAMEEKDRGRVAARVAAAPRRKAVFSNCIIYSGDSGGPLVNSDGEVVGVTFAVAARGDHPMTGFSYHVHREAVADFAKDRPVKPIVAAPDPWPAGTRCAHLDLDNDKSPETIAFAIEKDGKPQTTGMLIDPEQSGPPPDSETLADPKLRDEWKYRMAIHLYPKQCVFYDTKADGRIDLILLDVDKKGLAHRRLTFKDDAWKSESIPGEPWLNLSHMKLSPKAKERLQTLIQRLGM